MMNWEQASKSLLKDPSRLELWQTLIYDAESSTKETPHSILGLSRIFVIRQSYRAFLARFPLFSKYWSSLAKWEFKLGSRERASEIFMEGMKFVSFDIDYWVTYLTFISESITDDTKEVLELFEEARYKIGYSYFSGEYYALYLSFLKSYATHENRYMEKYALLLRHVIELPIYNGAIFLKELLEYIAIQNIRKVNLGFLLPDHQLKQLKDQENNNFSTISQKLDKCFRNTFEVSQFKIHEMYLFESQLGRHLQFSSSQMTSEEVDLWHLYLDYIEQNYPFLFLQQVYERLLLVSALSSEFAIRYFNLLLLLNKRSQARSVLERISSFVPTRQKYDALVRLVDLEIHKNNLHRARDLIINNLELNNDIPFEIYEKLVHLESLVNPRDDGTYLCKLTTEIVLTTNSTNFLINLRNYKIVPSVLVECLKLFLAEDGEFNNVGKQMNTEQFERLQEFYFRVLSLESISRPAP